jgi:hypothetical protein
MGRGRKANVQKLNNSKNGHILRKHPGQPMGDRYVYSVSPEDANRTTYLIENTGYIAMYGIEDLPAAQHEKEQPGMKTFSVSQGELNEDFVAI